MNMEEYKFGRHARIPDKYKDFPEAKEIQTLVNNVIDIVNNGHYSEQAVLNALSNLLATVVARKLSSKDILTCTIFSMAFV